jgi:haloalkane dehalogenase
VLRTPEESFHAVPGFDHPPRYAELPDGDGGSLRMAWVEAGPAEGPVVLLLHGEPTWSFLYRSMLGPLADAGLRAVAPDLVGFGRSDKPAEVADHTYARHLGWLRSLVLDELALTDVTLFCQDWGGLLGLRLVAERPDLFARVVASNTGLPTGDRELPPAWRKFREMVLGAPALDVGRMVAGGCVRGLAQQARAGYDAPFPDPSYTAGPRAMPSLVPTSPDDPEAAANRAAWAALARFDRPFLTAFSDSDPITGGGDRPFRKLVPGAAGLDHPTVAGAGHFVQEDAGPELARIVVDLVRAG